MSAAAPSKPLRHGHTSLYHGAKTAGVVAYLLATAALVDLLTTTETTRRVTLRLRARLAPRWRVIRRGEYLTAFRRRRFRNVRGGRGRLTRVHTIAAWRDLWVHRRILVDKVTGETFLILVGHLAASVEHGDRYRNDARYAKDVRTHRDGLAALGALIAAEEAAHPDWRIVLAGDFNTDFHHPEWVRTTERATGLQVVWDGRQPDGGTHAGGRLIDAVLVSDDVEILAARLSPVRKPRDVDHGGLITRYRSAA